MVEQFPATSDWSSVRAFLVRRRKSLNLTQEQFSAKLGFSENTLGLWERGVCIPSAQAWIAWTQGLGLVVMLTPGYVPQGISLESAS